MADFNPKANRYSHTPRKVFDKAMDRMDLKRQRDREDHRADMAALIKRLLNLEREVTALKAISNKHDCTDPTCKYCSADWDALPDRDTEEL